MARPLAVALALAIGTSGCFRGGGRLFGELAWTAIVTAAIVSAERPPEPQVIYVPEQPREGYTWQPGYWTLVDGDWEWVEGSWIRNYPGYRWRPAHWVEDAGGHWRLIPGRWIALAPRAVGRPPAEPPPEPAPPPAQER